LGLTIAEKIIEIHKGSISFESTLDKGSSVKIKLPKDSRDFIS
jgi:signal transduction histidine kinase